MRISPLSCAFLAVLPCIGCGTMVPQIGEIWDDNSGAHPEKGLELLIKNKVYCELSEAVTSINYPNTGQGGFPVEVGGKTEIIKWIPEKWGVLMTLSLVVEESTVLSPGVTLTDPWRPVTVFAAPVAQSFKSAITGTFSTDATRTDKFTFYYLVPDLEVSHPECKDISKVGSSLLLEDNLGIKQWLKSAVDIRSSIGTSESNPQEALTYDVKFEIVTSAGATPTWTLVRVTGSNGSANLFNFKRDRTHELILTFGPSTQTKGGSGPSQLSLNEALAQQIGAAVSNALSRGISVAPQ
jgi:hypothetical protein